MSEPVDIEPGPVLLVCCDYNGHVRFTMMSNWRPLTISERRGEVAYVMDDCDKDGRLGIYRQTKGEPKTGEPRCADAKRGR